MTPDHAQSPAADIFGRISGSYDRLTAAEKRVADYVLDNRGQVQFLSITQLAEACGTAEATVSRFCRRLGVKGYGSFKLALAEAGAMYRSSVELRQEVNFDQLSTLYQRLLAQNQEAMRQTLELLAPDAVLRGARVLQQARRVYCMGQGGSMIMAQEAAHLFSTVSANFFSVPDSHEQMITAALLAPEDALLFFCYSGSTKEVLDVLRHANQIRAKVVLVTRFPRSPAASHADVVLVCGSNEGALQPGSVPAQVAQLTVLDILFHTYFGLDRERCGKNREQVARLLAEKHI